MTPLVPVLLRQVGASEVQTVDARELHKALGVNARFNDWIARRLDPFLFIENRDFVHYSVLSNGPVPRAEYALSIRTAKHIAMMERTAKGEQIRDYFIAIEEQANSPSRALTINDLARVLNDPRSVIQLISGYAERVLELQATVDAQRPAVEFAAHVTDAANDQSLAEVAKILGTGRQRLIDDLLTRRILYRVGRAIVPHQEHLDAGRFVVRESAYEAGGEKRLHAVTRVTGKGLLYLQKRLVVA